MTSTFTKLIVFVFAITASFTSMAQVPANNECSGAMDISSLFGQTADMPQTSGLVDNTNATTEASDPTTGWECFGEPDGGGTMPSLEQTLWFSFVGDGGLYYIETVECSATNYISDADTQIAIYGGECGSLVATACNEDGPSSTQTTYPAGLDFQTEAGVTYYMLIDGFSFNGTVSTGEFCVEVTQRAGVACSDANGGSVTGLDIVCFGASTEFSLADVVVPTTPLAGFLWVVSSEDISGSMTPTTEASFLGAFPSAAEPYEPALVNDGTQLPAGLYYFTPVTYGEGAADAEGNLDLTNACVFTSSSVGVTLLPELEALVVTDSSEGSTGDDGSASVTVTGGSGNYFYSWSNGETTASISGLAPGNYTCTIADQTGCLDPQEVVVTVTDATSTNNLELGAAITLAPNPTTAQTMISFDLNTTTNLTVRVMNVLGTVVFEEVHTNATKGNSTINVAAWTNGIYFVQVADENRQYTQRLVVQK